MRSATRVLILLGAATVAVSGCATKDWVRQVVSKQQADIDTKLAEQAQRVEGVGVRVTKVEGDVQQLGSLAQGAQERADAAHGRAEAAHGRADAAFQRAEAVDDRLKRLWANRHARIQVDVIDVTFGFDRWELDDGAQTALLAVVREMQANPSLTVDLAGYTDARGPVPYNLALSQRRVEAVRRFLVEKGIELPRIHAIGLGVLKDGNLPNAQKRRVTVRLMASTE